ncbi:ComEC/Rec2 family competence protein, partial [Stappia sp.]|uniref:ComEC/Rec2 family competence protein n=1 Tax=Stappia sp. TaxID=1870903 RepID=UPI003A9A5526
DTPTPATGDTVRLRARLMPPAPAVMPGGYDFAFRAYFDGIGASGFAFGGVEPVPPVDDGAVPWDLRASAGIERLRSGIAGRIRAALGDTTAAALAVALITGDRSGIPPDVTEALRTAGLAHILAISGLHMALFAGSVFFVLRALFALSSRLAQDWQIDVWAAGAALAAAAFYLAISGGSIATQRAFVMIALVLAGRLFGRRALTLRNAGVAMLLILAVTPEALVDPGFQMSFAAVIALIAAYEEMTRRRVAANRGAPKRDDGAPVFGLAGSVAGGLVTWFGAILLTSLIAGAATGAIGAYHFHRIAPLGPLVNLVAMPVVTIAVMPFAVLALALVPFGLEALPLVVMGGAVDQVVAVSQWAASLTPGEGTVGAPSVAGTVLAVLAGTMACLAPRGFRRVALVPLCVSAWFYATHRQPDILVSANGTTLALRDAGGALRVTARPSSFIAEVWLRADGVGGDARARRHLPKSAMSCDPLACLVRAHGAKGARPPPSTKALQHPPEAGSRAGKSDARSGEKGEDGPGNGSAAGQGTALRSRDERETVWKGRDGQGRDGLGASADHEGELATGPADRPPSLLVSIVRDPAAFAEDCARVDMIVSAHDAPAGCAAPLVLDRARLSRDGTTAIYLGEASNASPVTAIVPSYTRVRPWTPRPGMAR